MSLAIDIAVEHEAWTAVGDIDALAHRAVAAALAEIGGADDGADVFEDAELSLVLCNDAFIQELNKTWRGKDKATNVLSFPTDEPAYDGVPTLLGDIIVAYETSAREATDEGKSLADHLTHLIVHGVFHLFGFDHEVDDEADAMERLESRALTALGIASPYHDAESVRS
jgi:probable rRNA maturation factor